MHKKGTEKHGTTETNKTRTEKGQHNNTVLITGPSRITHVIYENPEVAAPYLTRLAVCSTSYLAVIRLT